MAFEPPVNIRDPGQLRGKIRTGAKTATKDQEREFLERFARLGDDPQPLAPQWLGPSPDPFARLRRRLARVQRRRASPRWLRWLSRGRRLDHAYAATMLVLEGGKIPSFASFKFGGRDVRFVLRGRGLREKLAAVQNHDEADVRLLGFLDDVRKRRLVLVSLAATFVALPAGRRLPTDVFDALLRAAGLEPLATPEGARCPHADATHPHVRFDLPDLGVAVAACRRCLERLDSSLVRRLEAHVLAPRGSLSVTRTVAGTLLIAHPEGARADLDRLVAQANDDVRRRDAAVENAKDLDLLQWGEEALRERLDQRPGGFVQVGSDLWLSDFDAAARAIGANDLERALLAAAWREGTPRARAPDAGLNKLLEPTWTALGAKILAGAAGDALDASRAKELATQRPTEAIAALARALTTAQRFAAYPRLDGLTPELRLVHDLFKAHRTGDTTLLQQRFQDGLRDAKTKPPTLALARAFGQSAGIEWRYAPHEKDEALFWEPMARSLALCGPDTFEQELGRFADAFGAPRPARRQS